MQDISRFMESAVDTVTGEVGHDAGAAAPGEGLDRMADVKIIKPVLSFTADGACHQDKVHPALAEGYPDAAVIVPPRV